MAAVFLWLITLSLFVVGFVGIFIPFLPGIGIIFLGILVYAASTGFEIITPPTVIAAGSIALLAWLADFYGGALGAKLGGGSWRAALYACLGSILGFVVAPPFGIIAGALIGALAGAMTEGRSATEATRIVAGSLLGTVSALIIQLILGLALLIMFLIALWR